MQVEWPFGAFAIIIDIISLWTHHKDSLNYIFVDVNLFDPLIEQEWLFMLVFKLY